MINAWPELSRTGDAGQVASFRGVAFRVKQTYDDFSHDLATYQYPYRKGGEVDDQGRGLIHFDLMAVFNRGTYPDLPKLIKACNVTGHGPLIHPIFGSFPTVDIQRCNVRHDDKRLRYAEVDLTFVVHEPEGSEARLFPNPTLEAWGSKAKESAKTVVDAGRQRVKDQARQAKSGTLRPRDAARQAFKDMAKRLELFLGVQFIPVASAADWLTNPLDWCANVDRIVQARLRRLLALPGRVAANLRQFAAEIGTFAAEVLAALGQAAQPSAQILADYIYFSATAGLLQAGAELSQAGLALETGSRFDGEYLDVKVPANAIRV